MRIGVVADTHVGDELRALPPEVCEILTGVDLILHAGDLCAPSVLTELGRVAPVAAVRGNHDRDLNLALPWRRLVQAGGHRIGLTHGIRPRPLEIASTLAWIGTRRLRLGAHCRAIGRRFSGADCIVFGHLHLPVVKRVGGVLFFSPGAVYQPELDPGFDWSGAERSAFRLARRRLPAAARRPAVGIIEVTRGGLVPRVVSLRRPLCAGSPAPPGPVGDAGSGGR